ncbi:MAG TPA: hypothetical protein VFT64_05510 [Rickettsiales bacterium]|nr:hypothetical protein [Rickettsiales bacterium]
MNDVLNTSGQTEEAPKKPGPRKDIEHNETGISSVVTKSSTAKNDLDPATSAAGKILPFREPRS